MTEAVLAVSRWAIPLVIFLIPAYGYLRGVAVYEAFVAGAEDGFKVAIKIIPFLVGMLVAISIFRASGAMDLFARALNPVLHLVGIPGEVLPLAVMRPLSGGGALGVAAELIGNYGPDSFIGRLASVMQGTTDTTFYVLTVYFGSVGVRRYRYALALGLIADISSLIAAVFICHLMFG
ncbi:spore maturation protein [Neomoorella thermoacetica]|uniref:Spore maturation protein B n=2 Tax=Neomoorella thermoacetica TaxID=1525 RepID=A0A1D7XB02_NEOTH|nr:spore maturation protein [Moorella thermoacetica]AKX94134.1 spore maturation protein B [Moorella thermoacetica]AKX96773.1 spore maturation protein B [Moorella thermoacetica]AOQ24086.1 Spore maturation protein B [Moorella thermoacetica]APC08526.1 spore maturation protein B [Moorella thermoacetica]OIQ08507.1 spore maturation protein B [Moorella thermoacetica]